MLIPLLRSCQPKLASSANTLVLIVQLNWTTLFAPYEFSHKHFLSRGDFKGDSNPNDKYVLSERAQ